MDYRLMGKAFLFCAVLILASLDAMLPANAEQSTTQTRINCDIHRGPCTQTIGDFAIELDVSPKPVKAMTDLTFRVTITGGPLPDSPHIDLGMPGMEMGPNKVVLEKVDEATYEGNGVIVRCPSGKRIWKATVTIPAAGSAGFVFDVIY